MGLYLIKGTQFFDVRICKPIKILNRIIALNISEMLFASHIQN